MAHSQTNAIARNSPITDPHQDVAHVVHAAADSNNQRHCPGLIRNATEKLDRQLINVVR